MSDLRFTDKPVPRVILENVANWVHAYGEEGRKGQDESTIKPQSQQRRIDSNTQYTAADIWLANGDATIGLLQLSSCDLWSVSVYEGECIWCVRLNVRTGLWEMDKYCNPTGLRIDDKARFPLRYCSRLPFERRRPMTGIINPDGRWSEWVIK